MLCKRCLNLPGEYMNPIKPDTLQSTRPLTRIIQHRFSRSTKGRGSDQAIHVQGRALQSVTAPGLDAKINDPLVIPFFPIFRRISERRKRLPGVEPRRCRGSTYSELHLGAEGQTVAFIARGSDSVIEAVKVDPQVVIQII